MKKNMKMKLAITLSTFGALMFLTSTPANAGMYGSTTVLPTPEEVHEPVDAGVEDLIPQLAMTLTALSGLTTTSVLIKKLK